MLESQTCTAKLELASKLQPSRLGDEEREMSRPMPWLMPNSQLVKVGDECDDTAPYCSFWRKRQWLNDGDAPSSEVTPEARFSLKLQFSKSGWAWGPRIWHPTSVLDSKLQFWKKADEEEIRAPAPLFWLKREERMQAQVSLESSMPFDEQFENVDP